MVVTRHGLQSQAQRVDPAGDLFQEGGHGAWPQQKPLGKPMGNPRGLTHRNRGETMGNPCKKRWKFVETHGKTHRI